MTNCTTTDLYKSVRRCPGQRVAPGIRAFVYFILKSNIVSFPKLADKLATGTGASMADLAVLTTDFVLAADKKWQRLDLVDLRSSIASETQGEPPSATFNNTAEFIVGGTDEEITGLQRMAINDSIVFLVPDRTGKFRLLGNEDFDCVTTCSQASGANATDQKQSTVAVAVTDYCPAPFYQGTIATEDDGDIDGKDGTGKTTT